MNSRERLFPALNHHEPDRIPFDMGSTQVTGIHVVAYRNLRQALGLSSVLCRGRGRDAEPPARVGCSRGDGEGDITRLVFGKA